MTRSSSFGRMLAFVALALVLLVAVLVLRAFMLKSKQLAVQAIDPVKVDAELAAQHLAGAIQFRTVSEEQPSVDAVLSKDVALEAMRRYLATTYPQTHARLEQEVVAEHSLLYTWKGRDANLEPILLAAHMDVVPAEEGAGSTWTHPPFTGVVDNGFVWGRGAIDDKFCMIAIFEAVEHLIGEGFEPERTIYL